MKSKKHIIFFILISVAFVAYEYFRPKPIDWSETYSQDDKIPYGTYILNDILQDIFPEMNINENTESLYMHFKQHKHERTNYLSVTKNYDIDKVDTEKLLNFVETGNIVFIAAKNISYYLKDTLQLAVDSKFDLFSDSLRINFSNPQLKNDTGYHFPKEYSVKFFSSFDTVRTTVLGVDNRQNVNFIKVQHGQGAFYLNLQPQMFSNYNILHGGNVEYVYKSLSYLPIQNILWDEYQKIKDTTKRSILSYIMSSRSFRVAYYLFLLLLIIYAIFAGKRKQKIIPIYKLPKNTSLEFVDTVGRLYLHGQNHKDIAHKKFSYFLEFIRSKYGISIPDFNLIEFEKISEKTGVKIELLKKIIYTYQNIEKQINISEKSLLAFNNFIEDFYHASSKKT